MSQDDDFPPTQQAPPPPPEPPPQPPGREGREGRVSTHTPNVYESIEQMLPARTWKENPLIWIALVVAMFMAVPLLASMATREKKAVSPPKARVEAVSSPDSEPVPAVAVPTVAPAPPPENTRVAPAREPATVNQLPPSLRPQTDASRQVITKCYENGRVVYTQTGACTGSMTAVPIDTGKNVIGPGVATPAGSGTR